MKKEPFCIESGKTRHTHSIMVFVLTKMQNGLAILKTGKPASVIVEAIR